MARCTCRENSSVRSRLFMRRNRVRPGSAWYGPQRGGVNPARAFAAPRARCRRRAIIVVPGYRQGYGQGSDRFDRREIWLSSLTSACTQIGEDRKEGFDVQVDDPVRVPAPLPRDSHCVERRLPRSIAIRVGMEMRVHHRFQDHLHHGLCDAIGHSRNAERARAAILLLNLDECRTCQNVCRFLTKKQWTNSRLRWRRVAAAKEA